MPTPPTTIDQLILLAFQSQALTTRIRVFHDPTRDPEGYVRALYGVLSGPGRADPRAGTPLLHVER